MKRAFGYCDKTGLRYPLEDLLPECQDGVPTGLLVGRDVFDEDHPQLQVGKKQVSDKQYLDNPRPDKELISSRALWAWNPVGGGVTELGSRTVGLDVSAAVGKVSIS